MKPLVLCTALAVASCGGWDMRADVWAKASEMCQPFGGVVAADMTSLGSGEFLIAARCANSHTVRRYFTKDEMEQ